MPVMSPFLIVMVFVTPEPSLKVWVVVIPALESLELYPPTDVILPLITIFPERSTLAEGLKTVEAYDAEAHQLAEIG